MNVRILLTRRPVLALACAIACACAPAVATAQRAIGPWDDFWTMPSGAFRISLAPRFLSARERFSNSGSRELLGAPFAGIQGSGTLTGLSVLDNAIGSLSGTNTFHATIGTFSADQRFTASVIPLDVSLGVTSRVTLRASVPYHTGQNEIQWLLDGSGATVGANPAFLSTIPLGTNTTLVTSLDAAAGSLEALADACIANPASDARCAMVNAEMNDVRALIDQARSATNDIAHSYGGRDTVAPALFVPFANGATHAAVVAQIESLRASFEHFGTTSVAAGAAPVGAVAPATLTEVMALLSDSAYGYALGPISRRYQQGLGDIDIGASLLLYDGLKSPDPWTRERPTHLAFRQTVGVTYRLGTGTGPSPDDPLRVPTGDAQDDIEITSITDIIAGSHAWGSAIVQFTKQQPRDGIARIPDASGFPLVPLSRRRFARTELGNRLMFEAAPRWGANDHFAAGLRWRYTRQDGVRISELNPESGTPLSYVGPDLSWHEVGIGFTWSNIGAWRAGKSGWPIELQWDHSLVIAGSGGIPRLSGDRVSLRWYSRLWGR